MGGGGGEGGGGGVFMKPRKLAVYEEIESPIFVFSFFCVLCFQRFPLDFYTDYKTDGSTKQNKMSSLR